MAVTHDQALEQALQLYNQNAKYEDIAEHLKKIGYISERTRKPLTGQAVRHNIVTELKRRGESERGSVTRRRQGATTKDQKTPANEPPMKDPMINVGGDKADLLDAVKQVLELEVSAEHKLKVVKALLS